MPTIDSITVEQTKEKAAECITSKKGIACLLSNARRKANENYEFLITAWESLHIFVRMIRAQFKGK